MSGESAPRGVTKSKLCSKPSLRLPGPDREMWLPRLWANPHGVGPGVVGRYTWPLLIIIADGGERGPGKMITELRLSQRIAQNLTQKGVASRRIA
jgi:hypothetical protein